MDRPLDDHICIAPGPMVKHDNVNLMALNASILGERSVNSATNKQEKRLIEFYKNQNANPVRNPGQNVITNKVRALVSLNKKRFQEDGVCLRVHVCACIDMLIRSSMVRKITCVLTGRLRS